MPLYRSDAFVLRTYTLGEADQIVVFFTRDLGKLRVIARSSRNPRRATTGYYQPLTLLHAIVFGRPTQPLYRLNSVDILQSFRTLHEDFERLRCGLYVTELLDVSTREREPAPELFTLYHLTLEELVDTPAPASLLRLFEIRLLMLIGYAPQLLECARCSKPLPAEAWTFSARFGGLVCPSCTAEGHPMLTVTAEAIAYLRQAMAGAPVPLLAPETSTPQELERLLHLHLTACLGRELKSYAFLHL